MKCMIKCTVIHSPRDRILEEVVISIHAVVAINTAIYLCSNHQFHIFFNITNIPVIMVMNNISK